MDAAAAMEKLMDGNRQYLNSGKQAGDVSAQIRSYTAQHGQSPFAVIVSCSDSRVIPEVIFQLHNTHCANTNTTFCCSISCT